MEIRKESIEKAMQYLFEINFKEIFMPIPNMGVHVAEIKHTIVTNEDFDDMFFVKAARLKYRNSSLADTYSFFYAFTLDGDPIEDFDFDKVGSAFYKKITEHKMR